MTLYPIADVHFGAQNCLEKEFKAYIRQIQEDNTAAILIAGDMINNGLKNSKTNVYEEKYSPGEQKRQMIDILRPVADKIIAGVRGNHEYRTARETDIDIMRDIFAELGILDRYMGGMGIVKISVGQKRNGKPATYSFCLTHGTGGGQTLGAGLNKADSFQYAIEGVDGIISGHTHKPSKTPSGRLFFDPRNNNVTLGNTVIFVCTAWLDYGGYAADAMFKPTAFKPDTIRLDGRIKRWD